jgi:predicted DNA-binding transcriptional regulator AlpA
VIFSSDLCFISTESGDLDFVCYSKQISADISNQQRVLNMTDEEKIKQLPDCACLNAKELSELVGLSIRTITALEAEGKGPKRVRLSKARFGYTVTAIREWLAQRETV